MTEDIEWNREELWIEKYYSNRSKCNTYFDSIDYKRFRVHI